ncbi:MAG: 6-phosphogluconolactonase [Thiohalomonadales bacterium]
MTIFYHIAVDKEDLCTFAADYWLRCYSEAVASGRKFSIALSGGGTPKSLYQLMASKKYSEQIDWRKVDVFFGDERCVPLDHVDSNYLMATTALLGNIDIPVTNIHSVPFFQGEQARSADSYQHEIRQHLFHDENNIPQFDLVLLGMGDDGHTASLFPGTTILEEQKRWVSEVYVQRLDSWRISLTYPVINNTRHIMVLVAGAAKSEKIAEILLETGVSEKYPIQGVAGRGDMLWLMDKAAAANLDGVISAELMDDVT